MGTTTKGLHYPDPSDPVNNVDLQIKTLAQDVDALLVTAATIMAERFRRGTGSVPIAAQDTVASVTVTFAAAIPGTLPVPVVMVTQNALSGSAASHARLAVTAVTRTGFTVAGVRNVGTSAITFDYIAASF